MARLKKRKRRRSASAANPPAPTPVSDRAMSSFQSPAATAISPDPYPGTRSGMWCDLVYDPNKDPARTAATQSVCRPSPSHHAVSMLVGARAPPRGAPHRRRRRRRLPRRRARAIRSRTPPPSRGRRRLWRRHTLVKGFGDMLRVMKPHACGGFPGGWR